MSLIFLHKQSIFLLLATLALLSSSSAQAQDSFSTPTPTPDPLAGIPVQILDQQQMVYRTHTITFNLITPPVFPSPSVSASRSAQTQSTRTIRSSSNTNEQGAQKAYKLLYLSATVYDHQFTELRWPGGTDANTRVFINVDFAYFTTITTIETADTVYELFFAWGNDTVDSLTQAGRTPPNMSAFPAGRTSYQVSAGGDNISPETAAALNALCVCYDANSTQMVAAYNQRQSDNAAYQHWLQDHPPKQADTVINYWPVKSQTYLPAGR